MVRLGVELPEDLDLRAVTPDPHRQLLEDVWLRVLLGPGESPQPLRAAAATGEGKLPDDLVPLVEKIRSHAYQVTDVDVARVQASYGDDQLFEVIVSAALGAARRRLDVGLRALEQA